MGKGIKVSPKHGLNPTIPICFWCGKERGEVALLGRLPGDAEAPKNVVLDYDRDIMSPASAVGLVWPVASR